MARDPQLEKYRGLRDEMRGLDEQILTAKDEGGRVKNRRLIKTLEGMRHRAALAIRKINLH